MKKNIFSTLIFATLLSIGSFAKEDHKDHAEQEKHPNHESKSESDDHKEPEESPQGVGPNKGITEADEHQGFKLSSEAVKNFKIMTTTLGGNGPWDLPISAKILALEETNLYRLRNGFYKRIDFTAAKTSASRIAVSSKELKNGDGVVINGVGFLRIAELTAFGGAPEGHSH